MRPESLPSPGVLEGSLSPPLSSEGPKAGEALAGVSGEGQDVHIPLPGHWWEEIQPEARSPWLQPVQASPRTYSCLTGTCPVTSSIPERATE